MTEMTILEDLKKICGNPNYWSRYPQNLPSEISIINETKFLKFYKIFTQVLINRRFDKQGYHSHIKTISVLI